MQVSADQLPARLAHGLAPIYVIAGGEPFQTRESADAIRAAARRAGYTERLVFEAEPEVDWPGLESEAASLSLFAARRLLEVRLPGSRPGPLGAETLARLGGRPPPDVVLLLALGKLEARQRDAAWLSALERAGVLVTTRPVAAADLPTWIRREAERRGQPIAPEAAALLAERVEGNLLACDQELRKLALLFPDRAIEVAEVLASTGDSARYDVYALVDSALAGDARRAVRILSGLRGEGLDPPLVVWALAREVRVLAGIANAVERGEALPRALARYKVWESRKALLTRALRRAGRAAWFGRVERLAEVDRQTKGLAPGDPWETLARLVLDLAGVPGWHRSGGAPAGPVT
jgi:DNA polymerase-3 subunit delta